MQMDLLDWPVQLYHLDWLVQWDQALWVFNWTSRVSRFRAMRNMYTYEAFMFLPFDDEAGVKFKPWMVATSLDDSKSLKVNFDPSYSTKIHKSCMTQKSKPQHFVCYFMTWNYENKCSLIWFTNPCQKSWGQVSLSKMATYVEKIVVAM